MRIVIDMQGAQTESRFRGIGRYTMSFAQAVARNRGEHDIILALNGLFPETIDAIRAAFDGLLPETSLRVWQAPGPVREEQPENQARREMAELIREAFLASLQPDVIHVCSLFEGYVDDAVTSVGRLDRSTPVSVTLHDLIPLLNPDHYLKPNPQHERYYRRKIEHLRCAAVYLAVSESSRREGIDHAGLPDDSVVSTSEAADDRFRPVPIDDKTSSRLWQTFGITRPFILYSGGADERKNLSRLIEAYAALPKALRNGHQLLLAGKMPEGEVARLKEHAQHARLHAEELRFTGYISDEELVQLYNLCRLYIFPSWHEGFGLPALEAMACGAPVIGANTSSLPEVIGQAEALFDPFSIQSMADKLRQALKDDAFRARLREHGLRHVKSFSWDETARRAIAAWETLPTHGGSDQSSWQAIRGSLSDAYRKLMDGIARLAPLSIGDIELRQLAVCLDRNEQEVLGCLRPCHLPEPITWRLEGPFDSSYSLALVNRETARALAALGHRIVLHSTEGPGDFPPDQHFLRENPDLSDMHRQAARVAHGDADVVSRNLYPPRVSDMSARFNFLHGYAWEETGFPAEWVEAFNSTLQGVMVVSRHVRKIMLDHGVTVPVEVTSNGIDHWQRIESDSRYHLKARSFRFLHVSSCFPRKGADIMLRAYGRAFRASDDVTLIVKTFDNPHNDIYRWLDDARREDPDFPHVEIIVDDLADAELKALYEQSHALVAPSRAEGFGLPMAEAMLSGLAVITTGWSGQTDFCTPDTAWLIDYRLAWARTHLGLSSSVWAEPDEIHLSWLMKEVRQMPAADRRSRIEAGQRLLLENFRWVHAAERMVHAARNWAHGARSATPRIGWITTWNIRCGIATYSEHLINNMPDSIRILAAHSETRTAEDGANVHRCWETGHRDALKNLERAIEEDALDTLVIQFNYGFFDLETFSRFLHRQVDARRKVFVTLHATIDPAHAPDKKLTTLASALERCCRVLVHAPGDLNRLMKLGVVENVTLFPHGVLDYDPPDNLTSPGNRGFVVASYGFFLPHKGLPELVEAVSLLRSKGVDVILKMLNAEYPVKESKDIIQQVRSRIGHLHLEEAISLCTDYLSDAEILEMLSRADLIVFPYQETGESASGAVRYGIISGRPVAVTPLAIFDDVDSAVYRLPGLTSSDIAEGIHKIAQDIRNAEHHTLERARNAERWRDEHRYSRVGARLSRMLLGCHGNR